MVEREMRCHLNTSEMNLGNIEPRSLQGRPATGMLYIIDCIMAHGECHGDHGMPRPCWIACQASECSDPGLASTSDMRDELGTSFYVSARCQMRCHACTCCVYCTHTFINMSDTHGCVHAHMHNLGCLRLYPYNKNMILPLISLSYQQSLCSAMQRPVLMCAEQECNGLS